MFLFNIWKIKLNDTMRSEVPCPQLQATKRKGPSQKKKNHLTKWYSSLESDSSDGIETSVWAE
jgi:hypothetical protein